MYSNKSKYLIRLFSMMAVILIATVIFLFSAQPGDASVETSMSFMSMFFSSGNLSLVGVVHWFTRKFAHMAEFAALAVSAWFFISTFDLKQKLKTVIPIAFAVLYAASDEIHQLFVEGRAGMVKDVFIDSLGAVLGVLIMSKLMKALTDRIKKKSEKTETDTNI